jgi:hypothetical protein
MNKKLQTYRLHPDLLNEITDHSQQTGLKKTTIIEQALKLFFSTSNKK